MSDRVTSCVTDCGQPAQGYYLCAHCTHELVAELRRVAELVGQLDATISRQTRTRSGVGVASRPAERPLPVDLAAAEVAHDLHNVLGTWARDIADRTGKPLILRTVRALEERETTPALAAWLLEHVSTMRTHPAASELHDEITDATARAWRRVDRPPERRFAGPCDECGTDLYGRPNAAAIRCNGCGTDYDADARRGWLIDQARDQLATPTVIARALPALVGHAITPAMIRGYAHRGRLAARPVDRTGRPRYRVGDVIDLVLST